jgi:hypothetical protein
LAAAFSTRINDFAMTLFHMGYPQPHILQATTFYYGLSAHYKKIIPFGTRTCNKTLSDATDLAVEHEQRNLDTFTSIANITAHLAAAPTSSRPHCTFCNTFGHTAAKCFSSPAGTQYRGADVAANRYRNQSGNKALTGPGFIPNPFSLQTASLYPPQQQTIAVPPTHGFGFAAYATAPCMALLSPLDRVRISIMDTGCSQNVFPFGDTSMQAVIHSPYMKLQMADGTMHVGGFTSVLGLTAQNGAKLILARVLQHSWVKQPLISVSQICREHNTYFSSASRSWTIRWCLNNEVYLCGPVVNDLCEFHSTITEIPQEVLSRIPLISTPSSEDAYLATCVSFNNSQHSLLNHAAAHITDRRADGVIASLPANNVMRAVLSARERA